MYEDKETIFIDLDGTLVIHNYDPDNIDDVFIPSTLEFLINHKDDCLVLTTARPFYQMQYVLDDLRELYGIRFHEILEKLPIGKRYLINDHKPGFEDKAIAINLERDKGFESS